MFRTDGFAKGSTHRAEQNSLRDIVAPAAAADTVGLVQKILTIAERGLGVLVDRDDDRLDMLIAPAFAGGATSYFRQRL
jgi:hypothetical protein